MDRAADHVIECLLHLNRVERRFERVIRQPPVGAERTSMMVKDDPEFEKFSGSALKIMDHMPSVGARHDDIQAEWPAASCGRLNPSNFVARFDFQTPAG